jgi:hypothetical protein
MSTPHWQDLGFLTPDAPECQRDVWALLHRVQGHLATAVEELALRTAEPSWAAVLRDAATRARELSDVLAEEAGEAARERVAADEALGEFEGFLGEVLASGHVPSLIVTGHAVLGELGTLPARLIEEVAGPWARPLCARVAASEAHRPLGRLFGVLQPTPLDLEHLRRLVRHLNGQLFMVYATWRQSFHVLGVDGEWMAEEAVALARAAAQELGLKVTRADLAVFRV